MSQSVFVGTVPLEKTSPLHEGAVLTIAPQSANDARGEPWRASIPAFQDESLFQEYSDAMRARRDEVILDDESQDW